MSKHTPESFARLIAAAPEMLEALKAIYGSGCVCLHGIGHPLFRDHSAECKMGSAAIAKATGDEA